MFIRWVVRGHKNSDIANVTFHDAYLVESYRDDEGNPRQRTVSYLGNVRQIGETFPTIERELFLLRAEHILNSLSDISSDDREQAMEQLQRRVPPLNHDEVMVGFMNTFRWYFRWWKRNGGAPSDEAVAKMLKQSRETANQMMLDS